MLASPPFRVNALPSFVTVTATVDPLSAVTPSTGATLVIRSDAVPVSLLVSDAVVDVGAVVSTVTVSVLALDCTLPAASVCVKLKMYTPSASAALLAPSGVHVTALPVPVMLASPPFSVNALPSFVTVTATVDPLSAVTPSTGATLVIRSDAVPVSLLVSDAVVEVGAVVSITKLPPLLIVVPVFPALSLPDTVTVAVPSTYVVPVDATTV